MSAPSFQPPPDLSAYVDLRIYDKTDQEIFEAALAAVQLNMPEWTPREGHTETLLLEGVALEQAESVVAINRVPGAVLETLLLLAGVEKDYGAAPTATVTITVADTIGRSVPGGTRLYLPTTDGSSVVTMLIEPPGLEIPAGDSTGTASVIGDVFTDEINGMPAGTLLQLASPVPFIEIVELATDVADGRAPETNDQWRDRGVARLSRLSDALVLPRHFEAAALEDPNVARVLVVDNNDPSTGGSGDDPGHVTVAVLGEGGALLSTEAKEELEAVLEAQALALLDVHVTDVSITVITLSVEVHLNDNTDPDAVTASVEEAIIGYLDPLTWAWGAVLRHNEVVALVDGVPGVDWVGAVVITGAASSGAGDYTLASPMTVPNATLASTTVTVV